MMLPQTAGVNKCPLPFALHRFAVPEMHLLCTVQPREEQLSDWSLCENTAEEHWNHLQSCITSYAEESIGR